jgi:hypothetical protein
MPINPENIIPTFCKNCTHRFVCSIQDKIRLQDTDVKNFNTENVSTKQSVSTINYVCRYKTLDLTV